MLRSMLICADKVYISFKPLREAKCLLVVEGVVAKTFNNRSEAENIYRMLRGSLSIEFIDLEGYTILPGFVDSHAHPCSLGLVESSIDLTSVESLEELLELLRREAPRFKDWVYGRGWSESKLGARPTRWVLDRAVSDKPVALVRVCGHAAVLNTLGLKKLGLLEKPIKELMGFEHGEPDGMVYEELVSKVMEHVKRGFNPVEVCLKGLKKMLEFGVTTVSCMGVDAWSFTGLWGAVMKGSAPRVRIYLSENLFELLSRASIPLNLGDSHFKIVGLKLFVDGSLGARTARLTKPYSDAPEERGKLLLDSERLACIASRASTLGLDVAVHAIGDEAIRVVLDGFRLAGYAGRVEHFSLAPPPLIELASKLGVRVSVQPRFLVSDCWAVERLGVERVKHLYPFKTMVKKGLAIGFSSDTPVEPPNPLGGVKAAVTRGCLAGYTHHESLDVVEALHLYTRGSALILREDKLGCLWEGCYADMVVYKEDPLETPVEHLDKIKPAAVSIDGLLTYKNSNFKL